MPRILGSDPGFANDGLVGIEFKTGLRDSKIIYAELVRTEKDSKKQRIRLEDDNRRRHGLLHAAYKDALDTVEPVMAAVEAVSYVRNSSTMCQVGGSWYGLYYMLLDRGIWTASYTPQELKKIATGRKSADKKQIIAAVERQWPGQIDWDRWPKTKRDHVADAAVAAWAAIIDPVVPWSLLITKKSQATKS